MANWFCDCGMKVIYEAIKPKECPSCKKKVANTSVSFEKIEPVKAASKKAVEEVEEDEEVLSGSRRILRQPKKIKKSIYANLPERRYTSADDDSDEEEGEDDEFEEQPIDKFKKRELKAHFRELFTEDSFTISSQGFSEKFNMEDVVSKDVNTQ